MDLSKGRDNKEKRMTVCTCFEGSTLKLLRFKNCYQGHISSLPSILSSVRGKCFQCTVHLDTNVTAKRSKYENI